jgi:capsular polysaccharide biosynthesis protein
MSFANLNAKLSFVSRQMLVKILQSMPISSEIIGTPKGFYLLTSDWISKAANQPQIKHRISYKEIHASHIISRSKPKTLGENIYWKFRRSYQYNAPATFVAIVPNGRVWGFSGSVIAPDDKLLADVSVEFIADLKFHSVFNRLKLPVADQINGTVAVLSATGGQTFFHFMFDVLPRLYLIQQAGIDLNEIDYFLVNSYRQPFHQEMLSLLGIPEEKIIESCKIPHLKADKLVVPSLPGVVGNPPSWVCEFLRKEFVKGKVQERLLWGEPESKVPARITRSHSPERIYISRSKANQRQLLNEDEVLKLLGKFGFENVVLETLSIASQVQLFASAKVIIAPHGAGLSNLVYCQPQTKIIEIFAPKYVNIMYWCISDRLNLDYYYLMGEGETPPDYVDLIAIADDITVNLDSLSSIMKMAGIE